MYAVSLRIAVSSFLPVDLRRGRSFINIAAISTRAYKPGERVFLSENARNAEVISCSATYRTDFDFNLG